MDSTVAAGAVTLLPSELIILNNEKLMCSHPAEAALVAAFLANEAAGVIRFSTDVRKSLFGLLTRKSLMIEKGPSDAEWPLDTLEYELARSAQKEPKPVFKIVYEFLGRDSVKPAENALEACQKRLTSRGLLEAREVRHLKIFKKTEFVTSECAQALLATAPLEPVRQLASAMERNNSAEWKLLRKDIEAAFNSRTDSSGPSFSDSSRMD